MKFWPAFALCLLLAGCAARVSDTRVSYDNATRLGMQEKAEKGDAAAQYELGSSYCCGESGFWDTKQAIHWWCLAAAQGHPEAKARLEDLNAECPAVMLK